MGKICKERLYDIFNRYILSKRKANDIHIIYFYEWSDVNRKPIMFGSIKSFKSFLNGCNIPDLDKRQMEYVLNNRNSYITCKNGSNELLIASNWPMLSNMFYST